MSNEEVKKGPVVVTGTSGFIGSWLVMRLMQKGYTVRATVRDPSDEKKTKPLRELPGSEKLLSLWRGDLSEEGSFDEVINGATAVFHVATPMNFESKDPENEVIKPTVEGVLSIMRACKRSGTVKRIVYTSSAGTVDVHEHRRPEYDESCGTDLEFVWRAKMTGWMYFVSKTLAEQAAWEYARMNNLDLITIIPVLVVGPFISTSMPPSLITALSLITGNEAHYSILKQHQLVHLDDLCEAHIFLLENPEANGRYICSAYDATIFDVANILKQRYPEYNIPQKFEGIDEDVARVHFSSKKLLDLGFKYRYTIEDMFDDAIQCCREKKLIPFETIGTKASKNDEGNVEMKEPPHPVEVATT